LTPCHSKSLVLYDSALAEILRRFAGKGALPFIRKGKG